MTKIYGHRGSKGDYPENTLLAFKKALEIGVEGMEFDVHLTEDDQFVVIHDATLDRTTTGTGRVKEHTLAELRQLSAGAKFTNLASYEKSWDQERIPTLGEVLELCAEYAIEINIELKTYEIQYPSIEAKLLKAVNDYGYDHKIIYSSFHLPTLIRLKTLDPSTNIAFLSEYALPFPHDYIQTFDLESLHLNKNVLLENPNVWKPFAKKIRTYTPNDEQDLRTLIGLGVEAIITDYPERALKLRNENQ